MNRRLPPTFEGPASGDDAETATLTVILLATYISKTGPRRSVCPDVASFNACMG